ncbi:MAG: hypothetical protein CMB80_04745 [Flammeovirgaceae bacterium]|nr:hypothetical protein [Flammeovirgaceae bacterium]|tara:strand:+ start:139 stop:1440 length:1302 start_codon:yes stop_codon:yes gene_type:complete
MRKRILLKGPLLTCSGYGEQSRFALRALMSRPDLFEIFIQPLQWGQTSWLSDLDAERAWIDQVIEKTIGYVQQGGTFDIALQITIPNEWQKIGTTNIGYTAGIETTKVTPQWIEIGNQIEKIVVVSNHSKNVYANTSYVREDDQAGRGMQPGELDHLGKENLGPALELMTEVVAVNYPVKEYENTKEIELNLEYDFNFLTVAQMGPRKNLLNSIKWFVEEFRDEEVGLVVKTNRSKNCVLDREFVFNELGNFTKSLGERKCKIYILHGDMSEEEMHALYVHPKLKAFVTFTHGEGFGLPIFEAAYSGMPVVSTGWSGQMDFLVDEHREEHFYNVSFDIQPIPPEIEWEGVITKESMWAYPREQSAKEQMRCCYEDIVSNVEGSIADNAGHYRESLQERFSKEKMYAEFVSAIVNEKDFDVESWLEGLNIQEIE